MSRRKVRRDLAPDAKTASGTTAVASAARTISPRDATMRLAANRPRSSRRWASREYTLTAAYAATTPATTRTAAVPLAVLAWGARSRRTFLLHTGIVLFALSLVTLRHYVHIAPLWAMLTLSGAALVVLALAVERALRRARQGDIAGFTADSLFSDERRQHALQIVPVVAAFTSAAPGPAAQEKDFTGGGGKFGGGGAGEKF